VTSFSLDKFEDILKRSEELEKQLNEELTSDQYVRFSKEYSEIQPLVSAISEWKKTSKEISDLEILLEEKNTEKELKELAEEEFENLVDHLSKVEENIKLLLLQKDKAEQELEGMRPQFLQVIYSGCIKDLLILINGKRKS
jgi:peptide chain release factor 1